MTISNQQLHRLITLSISGNEGMFACWTVTTQCCDDTKVTILDDTGKVYATYTKAFTQSHNLTLLGQGNAIIEGNELRVYVDSSMSSQLIASTNTHLINDLNAQKWELSQTSA